MESTGKYNSAGLVVVSLILVACGQSEPEAVDEQLVEVAQVDNSCMYAGKKYSVGAIEQSKRIQRNAQGETELVDDPNGIYMRCAENETGNYVWLTLPDEERTAEG